MGNFQSSYETRKSFMKNIMRLILEEIIMSDRHMSDGQIYSFLQVFFNTEKIRLNWRLDSTVTDYVLLIFIGIRLWKKWASSNICPSDIKYKDKKNMQLDWALFFLLTKYFFFLTEDTEEQNKMVFSNSKNIK